MTRGCALVWAGVLGLSVIVPGVEAVAAEPPAKGETESTPRTVVEELAAEAERLRPQVETGAARALLDAVKWLPEPKGRVVYRSADRTSALTEAEFAALPEEERAGYVKRELEPEFYYYTGYGSPLISVRAFDLAAAAGKWESFSGKRVLDFGYGSIGQGRLLGSVGAEYTGIEVEPVLQKLYSGDVVERVRLLHGRWPAEKEVVERADESGAYDLFISKNTLKRGYIHPAREVDEKYLVKLGVDDAAFLSHVHRVLKPGGLAMIYNISPAQNSVESGKPYLPHADGQCPFTREQIEKAGFEVIEFDRSDTERVLDIWVALGITRGQSREEQAKDLFAWWTLLRKPRVAE